MGGRVKHERLRFCSSFENHKTAARLPRDRVAGNRPARQAQAGKKKTPEPVDKKVFEFLWCVANQNGFRQTVKLYGSQSSFFKCWQLCDALAKPLLSFQTVVKKLPLLPPLRRLTGMMDGRHIGRRKKRESHETDSSRLHPDSGSRR